MKNLSRRKALKAGGAALAVTATLGFPMTAKADDSELLARVADFWTAYEKHDETWNAHQVRRPEIEAMPDYPPELPWDGEKTLSQAEYELHRKRILEQAAFRERHGDLWEAANEAGKQMGAAANAVFAIPAKTAKGAVAKLKIARRASGATAEGGDGDAELSCYQDYDAPWIDNAIADLERLVGGAA